MGSGDQSGTWGTTTNTNLGTLIEAAIAGRAAVSMTDADYTLTTANGTADEARNMILNISGALTATRNVICPAVSKLYVVKNATTGGQSIILKTSAGTGVTIGNGFTSLVFCDGTNVVEGIRRIGDLTIAGSMDVSGDALFGTTTTSGSVSNIKKTVGGIFSTVNGSTAGALAGTAVTLFTIPSVSVSTWLVSVQLDAADTPNYSAFAVVSTQNNSVRILSNVAGALLTISNSGLSIQGTQNSGVTTTIYWSAIRIM
jgi:hypothetical protein